MNWTSILSQRPHAIVGNKIDLPRAKENPDLLQQHLNLPVFGTSAQKDYKWNHLFNIQENCMTYMPNLDNDMVLIAFVLFHLALTLNCVVKT